MDDEKVIARFLETGDRAMFGVLVGRYQDRVFRLVVSVLGPHFAADAEDVCQEVFIKVYGKIRLFTGQAAFGTWLYRIAYNLAVDWKRRARFRLPHVSVEEVENLAASSDPVEDVLTKEQKDFVARALDNLPDLYRSAIYMYYWLELPIEEIGQLLNMPENTVKSHLFRGRNLLKAGLDRMFGSLIAGGLTS
jgi:RNA polymerase sigma-70 factor (ECF subfamily)